MLFAVCEKRGRGLKKQKKKNLKRFSSAKKAQRKAVFLLSCPKKRTGKPKKRWRKRKKSHSLKSQEVRNTGKTAEQAFSGWESVRDEYLAGGTNLRKLSEKWGLSYEAVRQRSRQEKWSACRGGAAPASPVGREESRRENLLCAADNAVRRIDRMLREEELSVEDIKKLTGALEDIRRTQMIRLRLDEEEQQVRIDSFRAKNRTERDEPAGGVIILAEADQGEE